MPTIEESIHIVRKPQEVFDYIVETTNLPIWDVSVVKADRVDDGPLGLGSRTSGASKVLGKTFEWTTELTEFEPPFRATYTSVEGRLRFSVTNVLEADAEGTKFSIRFDAESGLGGIFGRLTDPLIASAQARTVRANLQTLAELLVAEPIT